MTVKDIIKLMTFNEQIFIYRKTTTCGAQDGSCDLFQCENCNDYWAQTSEDEEFRGNAEDCPIKLSECRVLHIDSRYREKIGYRKKKERLYAIAIEVK